MISPSASAIVLCVTGAECTGKSTLAASLAEALGVPLIPEVARTYLAGKIGYRSSDVLAIAREQLVAEEEALAHGAPLVVADTDLTVIQVWWEEKYGALDPWLTDALRARSPRRYLLTRPDLPWEPDPLRESPHDRERLHARYLEILTAGPFPFFEISGSGPQRFTNAFHRVRHWTAV
jgi:nicotinamide riboside kinase